MEFFLPNGEKRAFPRTRISLSCELVFSGNDRHVLGQCLDLSTTGAKTLLSEQIQEGVQARFKLREHLGKEPFEAAVEVTRVEKIMEASEEDHASESGQVRYCVGLKIIEIL